MLPTIPHTNMAMSGPLELSWENDRKMPFQNMRKHARQPNTKPQMNRTAIVKRKSGHLLCFIVLYGAQRDAERCAANDAPSQTAAQSAHPPKQKLGRVCARNLNIIYQGRLQNPVCPNDKSIYHQRGSWGWLLAKL